MWNINTILSVFYCDGKVFFFMCFAQSSKEQHLFETVKLNVFENVFTVTFESFNCLKNMSDPLNDVL